MQNSWWGMLCPGLKRLGFLLLLALLLGGRAHGQRITDWGRQIEAVHSVAGVSALRDSVMEDGSIELDSLQQDLHKHCKDCHVTIPPPWQKADLDGDGRIDLLICDGFDNVAILNRGTARPLVLPVPLPISHWRNWCRVVSIAQRGRKCVLIGQEIERVSTRAQGRRPPQQRSYILMYQLGRLTDYAARPRLLLPRYITFGYHYSDPTRFSNYSCRLDLKSGRIDGKGKASRDSARTGQFHYQLQAKQLDTLRQRLRYLPVGRLQSKYSKAVFDAGFITLEFRYGWWPTKKVESYGDALPHSLNLILATLERSYEQQIELRRKKTDD